MSRITEEELKDFIYKQFCIIPLCTEAITEKQAIIKIVSELVERREGDKSKKN